MSDPADVAKTGFSAMVNGHADVIAGLQNKLQVAMAQVTPLEKAAEMHCAEPGTAQDSQPSH